MTTRKMNVGLAGRYKIVASKRDGSSRVLADWFDNLILDEGLNRIGTGGVVSHCRVGSDSTPPDFADSALGSEVASVSYGYLGARIGGGVANGLEYTYHRYKYRFEEGVAAGNLSEVGVGWADGLFSRALIKDDLGDPTTITVLSDELLDVFYEIRLYPDFSEKTHVVDISGETYTFTSRVGGMTTSANLVAPSTWYANFALLLESGFVGGPGGAGEASAAVACGDGSAFTSANNASPTNSLNVNSSGREYIESYVPYSHERRIRISFGLDAGSVAFGGLAVRSRMGCYQILVSPNIPKDSTKTLSLDFTFSWGRKT